jgi:hypothetical protein
MFKVLIRTVCGLTVFTALLLTANAPVLATQSVFLDFETRTGGSEHVYTPGERNQIQALMEADYAAFDFSFSQTSPGGTFSTLFINGDPLGGGLGSVDDFDFRNLNMAGNAEINVNGTASTDAEFVTLTANRSSHELGHLVGLRHGDSYGPIGSGIDLNSTTAATFDPTYPGLTLANETSMHIMESDNTGTPELTTDQFFSERSAVKLEFNESGTVVAEQTTGDHGTFATAQAITLNRLVVPNTITTGDNSSAPAFFADAVVITGSIGVGNEIDIYSFTGSAGDLFNFEIYSSNGINRLTDSINPQILIFDSGENILFYYSGVAFNNSISSSNLDSIIIDLVLPSDDTYFLDIRAVDATGSFATGDYEVLAFSHETAPEPSSLILLGAGLTGMAARRWRKRKREALSAEGDAVEAATDEVTT